MPYDLENSLAQVYIKRNASKFVSCTIMYKDYLSTYILSDDAQIYASLIRAQHGGLPLRCATFLTANI